MVNPGGRPCDCGGAGCLEAEASVAAILEDAARYSDFRSVDAVVAAARGSQPLADILTRAAGKLATALLTVVNLVDVDEIIIGGEHFRAVEQISCPSSGTPSRPKRSAGSSRPPRSRSAASRRPTRWAAALVFQSLLRSGAQPPPAAAGRSRHPLHATGLAANNKEVRGSRMKSFRTASRRRTTIGLTGVALVAALAASACSGSSGGSGGGKQTLTITGQYSGPSSNTLVNWWKAAAVEFKKTHPDVTVKINNIVTTSESTYYSKLDLLERSSSTSPTSCTRTLSWCSPTPRPVTWRRCRS